MSNVDFKASTAICEEQASTNNPYVADTRRLAGYDIEQLTAQATLVDVLFLQFTGNLPQSNQQRHLLEQLMIYLSTPSPREGAARAAMACGISKTNAEHLLPIALMSAGGQLSGAAEVEQSYRFLAEHSEQDPKQVANEVCQRWREMDKDQSHQQHVAPGFGRLFNDIDPITGRILKQMQADFNQASVINWVADFNQALNDQGLGILEVGLTAAVCLQLKLRHRESVGLYQLFKAPGLLAYGMEQTHRPVSAMPMLEDEKYELGQ